MFSSYKLRQKSKCFREHPAIIMSYCHDLCWISMPLLFQIIYMYGGLNMTDKVPSLVAFKFNSNWSGYPSNSKSGSLLFWKYIIFTVSVLNTLENIFLRSSGGWLVNTGFEIIRGMRNLRELWLLEWIFWHLKFRQKNMIVTRATLNYYVKYWRSFLLLYMMQITICDRVLKKCCCSGMLI